MTDENPPDHTIEALNLMLPEDQLKSFVLRWRAADPETRKLMETEAALKAPILARRETQEAADRRQVRDMFEQGGLEAPDQA